MKNLAKAYNAWAQWVGSLDSLPKFKEPGHVLVPLQPIVGLSRFAAVFTIQKIGLMRCNRHPFKKPPIVLI